MKPGEPAHEFDAGLTQAVEVDRRAFGRSDELRRRQPPRPLDVLRGVVSKIHRADDIHPPLDVPATIGSRHPDVLAHAKHDAAAGGLNLTRELDAARGGAHDHDPAIRQQVGAAVLHRRQAGYGGGQAGAQRRDRSNVARAARDHELAAAPRALACRQFVALPLPPHLRDADARHDGCARNFGIVLQEVHDLRHGHEAIAICAGIGVARQAALPVRRQEAKRVPPLRPP